jgi:hypothetical protein
MKKNIIISVLTSAVLALTATSCSDFLDKEYDASLSQEKIFNNANDTRGFLANIYTNLPDGLAPLTDDQFTGASRDCITDNAVSSWGLHYYTKVGSDGYTAADHPLLGQWNVDLYGIRKCNQFMKNAQVSVVGNGATADDENHLYDRYMAEARLLRAIFHFDLICWFGACPVITDVFDVTSDMNIERTPAADALKWVADECDTIIAKGALPFYYTNQASNWGRVSAATAYALKSRALLYRASPLNNSGNDAALWTAAANAAKDFITANEHAGQPYRLFVSADHPAENVYYESVADARFNPEIILARSIWWTNQVEKVFLPVGFTGMFSGAGRTNPTQNFVDCFEMADGKKISDVGSGYNDQKPFDNRDPRLAQLVFYHGMTWGRADDSEQRQLDMSSNEGAQGIDYSSAMGGTYTGYYLKKWVNNISCKQGETYAHAWPVFRYTEILLNAAEALCEANNTTEALTYINQIRDRAGMPHFDGLTKEELLDRIHNERRIELSFEDHRMWDLRRWKAYEGAASNVDYDINNSYKQLLTLYGVKITGSTANPVFTYGLAETVNSRTFVSPKNYLFPIPNNEVKRAPKLGQNPGWEVASE